MSKKPIYILGSGGHANIVRDIIECSDEWEFASFVDINNGYDVIQEDEFLTTDKYKESFVALGIGENFIRQRLFNRYAELGFQFPVLRSKDAIVSKKVLCSEGTIIAPGAILNAGTVTGKCCVINTGAIVEHDVHLENFVSAAPGAVICGGCKIGEGAYIGANATVLQNIHVNKWSLLAAGATLIENLDENLIAAGCPAQVIKSKTKETAVF